MSKYRRPAFATLLARVREPRRFIQVLAGPRQVGKTTLAKQVIDALAVSSHMVSADEPALRDRDWLIQQWELARVSAADEPTLLVLDEIQKISGWSETVKRLWDEDTAAGRKLKVMILGSAPLLVQRGLTESLAGRFEIVRLGHWSFDEMRDAFGWDLDRYLFFGGYPGAAALSSDLGRWRAYVLDSLIETTISRDVLLMTRVDKPALLRQLFRLACEYSGQIVAFTKLLGQLQDAGNTVTLAHYLELLSGAGMVTGLSKYSGSRVRQRGSSPKLLALNNALITATLELSPNDVQDQTWRGRLVESAVGAHLLRSTNVWYWRQGDLEVDYVVRVGRSVFALEVKSGVREEPMRGLSAFTHRFRGARPLVIGPAGIHVEDFLASEPVRWLTM